MISSGYSGRVGGGGKKHEIYVAAFSGHLFKDFFYRAHPLDPLLVIVQNTDSTDVRICKSEFSDLDILIFLFNRFY